MINRVAWLTVAAAAAALFAAACGSKQNCVPGAQVSCACPGGSQGAQACNADGAGYGTCMCNTGGGVGGGSGGGTGGGAGGGGVGGGSGGGAGNDGGADGGPLVVSIQDITTGAVGPQVSVVLNGVVAMSQKFLISRGSNNSCLWGVFVSAPGLTTTGPNTGLLVTSFGTQAFVFDGGTTPQCPRLGYDATGDAIPDAIRPGDVIDLAGRTAVVLPTTCAGMGTTAGQKALQATSSSDAGRAPVPTPHVVTMAEVAGLSSPTDSAFHDQWGGVKVMLTNVANAADSGVFTDQFGTFTLTNGVRVGDKVYYRGYDRLTNLCHAAPIRPPNTTFTSVSGFSYLDFCTWMIEPNDKCADLVPFSTDCPSATACQ